jgi:uroporphyrinogen decarboxylase
MQTGPQVSPRMYRKFFFPRHRQLWQTAKKLSQAKVMLHSCGSVAAFIPMFIEAGLDILQPIQTTARDMGAATLKKEFGRDLCLWGGGCDTQAVLPRGTPAEVEKDVRTRVEILSPNGGFVFQQVHNIMADIPPANIIAMLDAVNP